MSHIIIEKCVNCKFLDCVSVCPVDCFKEGENFLVIDQETCIDCAICVPECPVEAIIQESDVKKEQKIFLKINYELSKLWPKISSKEEKKNFKNKWLKIKNKLHNLKIKIL